ncbi:hypothetical protein L9F63_024120 [Diploptera punctata]|uniref:Ionotropic glutamate receptor C-terminal domain-containing protein n=1 Tax=Diploptera punctata TaxID=6984 RepID=A0AAD7ZHD4_DIPPU|nr:hypothetical protein L9F63_024120 [Diploptera punctata]
MEILRHIASFLNFTVRHYRVINRFKRKGFVGFGIFIDVSQNTLPFLQTYYTQTYTWFVPRAQFRPHWSSISRVFKLDTWTCILFSLTLVSLSLKCLDFIKFADTSHCFLQTWAIFLNVAVHKLPQKSNIRFLFSSWVMFSIAVATIFQAFMTSFFIDPGKGYQIDTILELEQSGIKLSMAKHENGFDCWQSMLNRISDYSIFNNEKDMLTYCVRNPNISFLISEEVFLYNFRSFGILNQTALFHKMNTVVINIHRTINMDVTSPYLPQVNIIIKRLVEAGIAKKLVDNFSDPSALWKRIKSEHKILYEYVPLSLFHLSSPFFYLSLGLTGSFLLFIGEIIVNRTIKCFEL